MTESPKRPIFLLAEQLVQTWIRNERDLAQLERLRMRSERARAYMRSTGSQSALVMVYLERLNEARRDCLIRLRSSRRQALVLLARADVELKSGDLTGRCPVPSRPASSSSSRSPDQSARKYA